MRKWIACIGVLLPLLYGQTALAEKNYLPGPGSHFKFVTSGVTVGITTKTPNHTYPNAGLQVLTPGYTVKGNVRPSNDGFYLFSVSDTAPANIQFLGNGGTVTVKICLNGVGKKYSCEKQSAIVQNSHVIFITYPNFTGNLGGVTGADNTCQTEAYQSGSIIPTGLNFKALLVTATRYPCSINGSIKGCAGNFASNWPLSPGVPYSAPDGSSFNTVNSNAVFDGNVTTLKNQTGLEPLVNPQRFWTGIQSILSNSSADDIVGWAYADMNSAVDNTVYANNFGTCNNFTSDDPTLIGSYGLVSKFSTSTDPIAASTWGNYYYFDNNQNTGLSNLFSISFFEGFTPIQCDYPASSIVCVS